MSKRLVILANAFPFGTWEPFLMTELAYVDGFDHVHIISLSVRESQAATERHLPDPSFTVDRIDFRSKVFYALSSLRLLVDANFYREFGWLVRTGSLSGSRLVTLLIFLARAHHEAKVAQSCLVARGCAPDDTYTFYSYRMAYQPYVASILAKRFKNSICVARAHGADLYEEFSPRAYLPLRDWTVSALRRIWCISEHGRDYLLERHPAASAKCEVRRLGTIDRGFTLDSRRTRGRLRIVTCSSISRVKRLDRLIDALSHLVIPVDWDHYGEGLLAADIEEYARRMLPPRVHLTLHGFVPNDQVIQRYLDDPVDYLINVSDSEGVPVSIMEAFSTGTPVIATDVGGTSELVEAGENGILLSKDASSEAIAGVLRDAAEMADDDYLHLRRTARRTWEVLADADSVYPPFVAELTSLV